MYFSFFVITLFIAYFISQYFFCISAMRLTNFDDAIDMSALIFVAIFIVDILLLILFPFNLKQIYISYRDMYIGMHLSSFGHNNFYLTWFIILGGVATVLTWIYYKSFNQYYNSSEDKHKTSYPEDVEGSIFSIPRIKRVYKIIGLALLGYLVLASVQYYFYLDRISPHVTVDKYHHFLLKNYDNLEQEGTKRLNMRYQGRYYDDVFNEISKKWTHVRIMQGKDIRTIKSLPIKNIKYQIALAGLDIWLLPNIWGGYSYCAVYLNFLEDGVFSEAETYCSEEATLTITP